MIINSTALNNRHKLYLSKPKKFTRVVPATTTTSATSNTSTRQQLPLVTKKSGVSDIPLILHDDIELNEIEEIERLNNDENFTLEVPITYDTRKISMPIIRKPSHVIDIDDFNARKYSTIADRRPTKSLYLPRSQSIRSKSIVSPIHNKHSLSLHPANFRNDGSVRNRATSIQIIDDRAPSLAKTATMSEFPLESRYQDEITGDLKFTTNLSKIGQCAMLKSYEDELYTQLKSKFPKKTFPRINTPTFNLHSSSTKTSESTSTLTTPSVYSLSSYASSSNSIPSRKTNTPTSSWDTTDNEQMRKFQVSRQIEEAMDILDDLGKLKDDELAEDRATSKTPTNDQYRNSRSNSLFDTEQLTDLNKKRTVDRTIKKYEKWQYNWSRMLNEMF